MVGTFFSKVLHVPDLKDLNLFYMPHVCDERFDIFCNSKVIGLKTYKN